MLVFNQNYIAWSNMDVDPGFPQSNSGVWSLNTFFFDVPLQRDKIPLITRALPLAAINYQVQYEAVNRFCHFVVVSQDTKESWKQKYLTEGGVFLFEGIEIRNEH